MLKPMDLRHRAEAYPPTGLYHNLLRLRWGAGRLETRRVEFSLDFMVEKWWVSLRKMVGNGGLTMENGGK